MRLTKEEYRALALKLEAESREFSDHRFAVVYGKLVTLENYDQTFLVAVYDCTECYNPSFSDILAESYRHDNVLYAYKTEDNKEANELFKTVIGQYLDSFGN